LVLVDSSIWIDFLQDTESDHNSRLEDLIKENNRAVICGIILQEVLQGIRDDKNYRQIKSSLSDLPFINTDKEIYLHSSGLYRSLRKKGVTVPSVDVTIASISILNKVPLFTKDRHFRTIARHSDLKLY
jgi:predicted nucleic acid-binding protein